MITNLASNASIQDDQMPEDAKIVLKRTTYTSTIRFLKVLVNPKLMLRH